MSVCQKLFVKLSKVKRQKSICQKLLGELILHCGKMSKEEDEKSTETQDLQDDQLSNFTKQIESLKTELKTLRREKEGDKIEDICKLLNAIKSFRDNQHAILLNKEALYNDKFNMFQRLFFGNCINNKCCCCCCCCLSNNVSNYYIKNIVSQKEYINKIDLQLNEIESIQNNTQCWNFEKRSYWNGGIDVVYNPISGQAIWKQAWQKSVSGVYNPHKKMIVWKEFWNGGIHGVYNPNTYKIEWKYKIHHGIYGVYNPIKKMIEWKEAWNKGVCGVWNPIKQEIEWQENWHGGICGYFDENEKCVKWFKEWHKGIAIIVYVESTNSFITAKGCCWDWND